MFGLRIERLWQCFATLLVMIGFQVDDLLSLYTKVLNLESFVASMPLIQMFRA
jgi:hypothetical protein